MNLAETRWPPLPSDAEISSVTDVVHSQRFTDGKWTAEVERRMCELTGAPHAVAFNSCTSAIHAVLAVAWMPRLRTSAFGFVGTITGALHLGMDIRFCNPIPDTLTLAPAPHVDLPNLAALDDWHLPLAVDLHGVPHTLSRAGTLTDACQALGTEMGGQHIGARGIHCWSFSSAKIVAAPDGGAVTLDDAGMAEKLRTVRNYGIPAGQSRGAGRPSMNLGHNWRPSEISMAMVAHRMNDLTHWADRSREVAAFVHAACDGVGLWRQHTPEDTEPAWHKLRIGPGGNNPWNPRAASALEARLNARGVPTHRWGIALDRHAAQTASKYPVAARLEAGTFCLGTEACPPMTWTDQELQQVCDILRQEAKTS